MIKSPVEGVHIPSSTIPLKSSTPTINDMPKQQQQKRSPTSPQTVLQLGTAGFTGIGGGNTSTSKYNTNSQGANLV